MRRAEVDGPRQVGTDGYERHPLLGVRVRDTASGNEGELTAVTHRLHTDGRVVRIAHIRPGSGVEWTTAARNIQAAVSAGRPGRDHAPREHARPWGASRLAPYPHPLTWPFTRTEIDPVTQTTLYFDAEGRAVDMSGHGTNQSTSSPTATGSDGGGAQPPPPSDSDALEDHLPD
ncbi:putative ATP-grasp-modified RiPP [Streptomyces sp. NPDC056049]|uniref:putative ATP-grasp-modified RiPP n=1 Tax=Streptomyces sp. NPDC056049 TaxID=3345693 RepID=UPI0035D9F13C